MDIAQRFNENPLLRPADLKPGIEGMEIVCLLNPGVFEFKGKIWLLLRVAERPRQIEGKISFPVYNSKGAIEILSFEKNDPDLDATDPRVINYKKKDYLTTLSYLRLVCSDDGVRFYEPEGYPPIFGKGELETFGIEDCRVATMDDGFSLSFTEVSE
ncbi:MAG: glycosidase, partial [Bacteroidales bacterium]